MPTQRALRFAKVVAASADRVRRPPPGLVVLIYHRVGGRAAIESDLPRSVFERQMAFLAERTRVVTLDEGLGLVADPAAPPEPLVAVTFDDGTADFADDAVPVLERYRVPVTLYVATEFVDAGRAFPHDARPLSWPALGDVVAGGLVTVGSHTHRHRLLDRLPDAAVPEELDRSVDLIGEHLGVAPAHFAYPKAVDGSPSARAAVRARFRSAALAGCRPNPYCGTDPYRLARSPVQVSDGFDYFVRKVRGGMRLEDDLRRVLNRRRYAHATA